MNLDAIEKLIEAQIENATENQLKEIYKLQERNKHLLSDINQLRNDKKELENNIKEIKLEDSTMSLLQPLISESNFIKFLESLSIEDTGIRTDGMDSEYIPVWFEAVVKFYDHRDLLFQFMDFADIKYPSWAKSFKMPYEYNEEELEIFFHKIFNFHVTNGEFFRHNMGFFWRDVLKYKGNTVKMLNGGAYIAVPWNLLLRNKLLTTDYFFDKVLGELSKNNYGSGHGYNFLKLPQYQEISDSQRLSMVNCLLQNNRASSNDIEKVINSNILKNNNDIARKLSSLISSNNYSKFYYANYPIEMQLDYIRNNYDQLYGDVFKKVCELECDEKDKISLIGDLMRMSHENKQN